MLSRCITLFSRICICIVFDRTKTVGEKLHVDLRIGKENCRGYRFEWFARSDVLLLLFFFFYILKQQ